MSSDQVALSVFFSVVSWMSCTSVSIAGCYTPLSRLLQSAIIGSERARLFFIVDLLDLRSDIIFFLLIFVEVIFQPRSLMINWFHFFNQQHLEFTIAISKCTVCNRGYELAKFTKMTAFSVASPSFLSAAHERYLKLDVAGNLKQKEKATT